MRKPRHVIIIVIFAKNTPGELATTQVDTLHYRSFLQRAEHCLSVAGIVQV